MAAMKSSFIEYSKERAAQDIANFGTVPEDMVEMFKKRDDPESEILKYCLDFLKIEPKNYAIMLYIATIYDERKQFKKALPYYRRITKAIPMIYIAWLRQGMCELMLQKTNDGRHSLMQYGYFKHGEWFPTCLIAMTYYMEDKDAVCFYFLDEVLKTGNIDRPDRLVWMRAFLEERRGNKKDALTHYIESMMMQKEDSAEDKAMTALKVRELTEETADDGGEG